jgi:hypothetical protein
LPIREGCPVRSAPHRALERLADQAQVRGPALGGAGLDGLDQRRGQVSGSKALVSSSDRSWSRKASASSSEPSAAPLQALRDPHLDQGLACDAEVGGAGVEAFDHPGGEVDVDAAGGEAGAGGAVEVEVGVMSSPASKAASRSRALMVIVGTGRSVVADSPGG